MDIRSQFTQFIKGFREQIDTSAAGDPVLADEAKYYAYLKLVRAHAFLPVASASLSVFLMPGRRRKAG